MAIKQKQEEQSSKLMEVLKTEYRWENLLLGVLAIIAIAISVMIISGNKLLQIDPNFPVLGEGSNGIIFAWVLFAISAFGLFLVLYPFFLPAVPELKKISWAKWSKFLDNSVRVLVFLIILTGFLLLYDFLITKLISGLLGGSL